MKRQFQIIRFSTQSHVFYSSMGVIESIKSLLYFNILLIICFRIISILDPWNGHDWKIHDRRHYNFARGQNCGDPRSWIFQLCPIQGSKIGIPFKYCGFFMFVFIAIISRNFFTVYWSGKPNHDRSWLDFPDRLRKDHRFQHTDYTIILIGIYDLLK